MRYFDVIGYYSSFPKAIPLCKAGYSRVTHPFATNPLNFIPKKSAKFHRSTCMCYARRQRLSWARIKLSIIVWSWLLSFFVWFTQSNSLYFYCSFLYIFWGSMPLLCNDYYIIPRSFYLVKYFFNFFIKILLFRLFVWSDIKFIIHYLNYFVNFYFSFWLCSLTVPLYNTRIFYLCQIFLFLFFCILKEPYFKVFLLFYKALFILFF